MSQAFPQPSTGPLNTDAPSMPPPLRMPTPPSASRSQQTFYLGTEVLSGTAFLPGYDYRGDVEKLYQSMRGWGTRDTDLIAALVPRTSAQMQVLQLEYLNIKGKVLVERIKGDTSGTYRASLIALASGALGGDAWILHKGIEAADTGKMRTEILTELLVARNRNEIALLRSYLHSTNDKDLDHLVRDLIPSGKTAIRAVFEECLKSEIPASPSLEEDFEALSRVLPTANHTSILTILSILLSRPLNHLAILNQMWQEAHFGTTISQVISRRLNSDSDSELRDVLVYAVDSSSTRGGGYGIWRDVELIDEAITSKNEFLLTIRLIRAHWDQYRFAALIKAFDSRSNNNSSKNLRARVTNYAKGNWGSVLEGVISHSIS